MKPIPWARLRLRESLSLGWRRPVTDAVLGLAVLLCIANGALVFFGYMATQQTGRGLELLRERRQAEGMALAAASLERDMKGAATRLLGPATPNILEPDPPYELIRNAAAPFVLFPYAESLVAWTPMANGTHVTHALIRTDQPPDWSTTPEADEVFPVTMLTNPPELQAVTAAIQREYEPSRPVWVLQETLAGDPYQIIVRYIQSPTPPFELWGFVALTVNLRWVREEYFGPVLHQAGRIGGGAGVLSFYITDEDGRTVTSTGQASGMSHELTREFRLLFVDYTLIKAQRTQLRMIPNWKLHVLSASGASIAGAAVDPRRSFALVVFSAALSLIGLILTVRAVESRASVTSMKADFVSAVTHGLKTPVAIIRLVADTLSTTHYDSKTAVEEYGGVLSREATRLSGLIDQLLTYAKYSEAQKGHGTDFVVVSPSELVESLLEDSAAVQNTPEVNVAVDVPASLPPIRVDVVAIRHAIWNLIENALKYSSGPPKLRISGHAERHFVALAFCDEGIGIPSDELPHVCERFYRGSNATKGGNGLGLAIVKRVIDYHRGHMTIRSSPGAGTEIVLRIPISR
jgi:signal transduction histidine kinase